MVFHVLSHDVMQAEFNLKIFNGTLRILMPRHIIHGLKGPIGPWRLPQLCRIYLLLGCLRIFTSQKEASEASNQNKTHHTM